MAFLLKVRSLLLTGLLSVFLLATTQEAAQAEPVLTSYYGEELAGNPTASGEPFDPSDMTAAHPYLPFGTLLRVTNDGQSVNVRVNDRGPYVPGRGLDLSSGAARAIGLTNSGVAVVEVESGEAPETKPPVSDSEISEPAEPVPVPSSEKQVVASTDEDSSSQPREAGTSYETAPIPEAPATRSVVGRGEQMIQTLYGRPVSLRRRSGELSEGVV
jgi:rare lipoprotein A